MPNQAPVDRLRVRLIRWARVVFCLVCLLSIDAIAQAQTVPFRFIIDSQNLSGSDAGCGPRQLSVNVFVNGVGELRNLPGCTNPSACGSPNTNEVYQRLIPVSQATVPIVIDISERDDPPCGGGDDHILKADLVADLNTGLVSGGLQKFKSDGSPGQSSFVTAVTAVEALGFGVGFRIEIHIGSNLQHLASRVRGLRVWRVRSFGSRSAARTGKLRECRAQGRDHRPHAAWSGAGCRRLSRRSRLGEAGAGRLDNESDKPATARRRDRGRSPGGACFPITSARQQLRHQSEAGQFLAAHCFDGRAPGCVDDDRRTADRLRTRRGRRRPRRRRCRSSTPRRSAAGRRICSERIRWRRLQ